MWDLTTEGDRRLKKLAVDKRLDGSDDSRREMERILHMDFAPDRGPPGRRGDLEATARASSANTDRADRTREPATRQEFLLIRVFLIKTG